MPDYKKILIPVDGSNGSFLAAKHVVELAQLFGTEERTRVFIQSLQSLQSLQNMQNYLK